MNTSERVYGGLIWTNHALERLEQRKLSQSLAMQAYRFPDDVIAGKQQGSKEYRKRVGKSLITLIIKPNEREELLVLSAWIDPPLAGTTDAYNRERWLAYKQAYAKAGFWGRWLLVFKRTLFGV